MIAGQSRVLHQQMMNEGPTAGHYQNIMNRTFTKVGIGLYYSNGILWLTEDFVRWAAKHSADRSAARVSRRRRADPGRGGASGDPRAVLE